MAQVLVRDGAPLSFDNDSVDVYGGDRVSLDRLHVSTRLLGKAAEYDTASDLITVAKLTKDETEVLIRGLQGLVQDVKQNCGKLIVRYVGDLKGTEYDLDAKLFHLAETVSQNEMTNLIEQALSSGKPEVNFINLANVRDIKVKVGHRAVTGVEDELRYVDSVITTLLSWCGDNCGLRIEDA